MAQIVLRRNLANKRKHFLGEHANVTDLEVFKASQALEPSVNMRYQCLSFHNNCRRS